MKHSVFFEELIWNIGTDDVEVYDTFNKKLCGKHDPIYYRKRNLFADRVVGGVETFTIIKNNEIKHFHRIYLRTEQHGEKFFKQDMAKDLIILMESLAKDSEKNGDEKGVYYYLSTIPFIKSYYGIKGEQR